MRPVKSRNFLFMPALEGQRSGKLVAERLPALFTPRYERRGDRGRVSRSAVSVPFPTSTHLQSWPAFGPLVRIAKGYDHAAMD
jgi:hypothetical protein